MDNLKCNILTCRRALSDKAVVTTCSHIFCIDCANALFNDSRLCPACETSLTEPDDVVVCSLHPSNDYKTSVLSGLNPAVILEICSRAMSFWQYQVHQEHSFQQTVIRNINEKGAYLQKELDSAVREARGQIGLLNIKINELERDFELERRKTGSLQDSLKDREKEYQKLKTQYDRIKRKALLAPNTIGQGDPLGLGSAPAADRNMLEDQAHRVRLGMAFNTGPTNGGMNMGAVVGGMDANGIQRTPITSGRTMQASSWRPANQGQSRHNFNPQRQPFNTNADRSFRSNASISDQSESEVENLVGGAPRHSHAAAHKGWTGKPHNQQGRSNQRVFAQPANRRTSGVFRPAGVGSG